MSRTRQWTAVGIVGVLALALGGLLWRSRITAAPTTSSATTVLAAPTSTSPTTTVPTIAQSSTTTSEAQRIAEVEEILTDLWFGWLDAIYRKDEDALWKVAATSVQQRAGLEAMETLDFDAPPTRDGISVNIEEILLDRSDCLVVFQTASSSDVVGDPVVQNVQVLWDHPQYAWRFASAWTYAGDLWQADCDEVEREVTP